MKKPQAQSKSPKLEKQKPQPRQQNVIQKQPHTWGISFGLIFFIFIFLTISIHLIFLIAQQPPQIPNIYYLHQAFSHQKYSQIIHKLQQKHLIIRTTCPECLHQIIKYYALKTKQKIVVRDYRTLSPQQSIYLPYFWHIKNFISKLITEPLPRPKIWIIHPDATIPTKQIQQLHNLQPKSSIYVILPLEASKKKIKIQGFKKVDLPDTFNILDMFKIVNLSSSYAKTYKNYYNNSIPKIFKSISSKSVSPQLQLANYYINITQISKSTLKIINKLCDQGKLKQISAIKQKTLTQLQHYGIKIGQRVQKYLLGYGVKLTQKIAYWQHDRYRLNYMLQTMKNCVKVDIFVPDQDENEGSQFEANRDNKCPPCQCTIEDYPEAQVASKQQQTKNISQEPSQSQAQKIMTEQHQQPSNQQQANQNIQQNQQDHPQNEEQNKQNNDQSKQNDQQL